MRNFCKVLKKTERLVKTSRQEFFYLKKSKQKDPEEEEETGRLTLWPVLCSRPKDILSFWIVGSSSRHLLHSMIAIVIKCTVGLPDVNIHTPQKNCSDRRLDGL